MTSENSNEWEVEMLRWLLRRRKSESRIKHYVDVPDPNTGQTQYLRFNRPTKIPESFIRQMRALGAGEELVEELTKRRAGG